MFVWSKEGGREGYRERVREHEMESERNPHNLEREASRGRVGLTLKFYELLRPSMTFKVILI
jgi:hypothetical protein